MSNFKAFQLWIIILSVLSVPFVIAYYLGIVTEFSIFAVGFLAGYGSVVRC